jgi:hypothetical protein
MNLDQRRREAERREKAMFKRAKREARRREKAAASISGAAMKS